MRLRSLLHAVLLLKFHNVKTLCIIHANLFTVCFCFLFKAWKKPNEEKSSPLLHAWENCIPYRGFIISTSLYHSLILLIYCLQSSSHNINYEQIKNKKNTKSLSFISFGPCPVLSLKIWLVINHSKHWSVCVCVCFFFIPLGIVDRSQLAHYVSFGGF